MPNSDTFFMRELFAGLFDDVTVLAMESLNPPIACKMNSVEATCL